MLLVLLALVASASAAATAAAVLPQVRHQKLSICHFHWEMNSQANSRFTFSDCYYYFKLLLLFCFPVVQAGDKITLDVYIEALCPYSFNFVNKQLGPQYESIAPFVDVRVIPYGNAHVTSLSFLFGIFLCCPFLTLVRLFTGDCHECRRKRHLAGATTSPASTDRRSATATCG